MSDTVKAKAIDPQLKPPVMPTLWAVIARQGKRYRVFGLYEFQQNAVTSCEEVAVTNKVDFRTIRIIEIPGEAG